MCTNLQYLSFVNNTRWQFSGSVKRGFGLDRSVGDYQAVDLVAVKRLLSKGLIALKGCGSCLECRVASRKEKAVTLHHESRYWKEASFVTLTYNDTHLPKNESVNSEDPAQFVKDLRKYICRDSGCADDRRRSCRGWCPKIKTFGCAEYGPKLSRPHYHLIIFGFQFPDLSHPKLSSNDFSKKKWFTYRSKICAEIWGKGFVEIGNLEPAAAEYVCGYTTKKITGEKKRDWYKGKRPEGIVCASKGIGFKYVEQYKDFLLRNGLVSFRKSKIPLPRKYKRLLKKLDEESYLNAVVSWTKEKELPSIYKAISPLRAKARDKIKKAQVALESRSYETV